MKYILIVFSVFSLMSFKGFSQKKDEDAIKHTVNRFFDGMNTSDSSKLRASLSKNAVFQTITKDFEVKAESIDAFVSSISKAEKGSLEEKIGFEQILIDGNLASVWTPYTFYFKGKLSHCGYNSFQLVKEKNEDWKIVHIIDTRRKDKCE